MSVDRSGHDHMNLSKEEAADSPAFPQDYLLPPHWSAHHCQLLGSYFATYMCFVYLFLCITESF